MNAAAALAVISGGFGVESFVGDVKKTAHVIALQRILLGQDTFRIVFTRVYQPGNTFEVFSRRCRSAVSLMETGRFMFSGVLHPHASS